MNQYFHTSFFRATPTLGVALFMATVTLVGCNVEDPADPVGAGAGTGNAIGGAPGSAGSLASGGMTTAGTTTQGGMVGVAGSATTAGQGGTGPAGGSGGASVDGGSKAGSNTGGNAGASGSAGSAGSGGGGSTTAPDPSAGCSKASPMTGSGSSPLTVSGHQYYVKLPAAYDASKPYRLLFVFNPTNNPITWAEQSAGFESNAAKDNAIRVYPHPANSASGWGASDVSFFRPLYDKVIADYCVDKARMFATGESSGGDFSSILGCEYGDILRGVAPAATKDVGGYPLDTATRKCKGEVTPIVIHGKNDMVVGPENGPKTRDFYAKLNHCGTTTTPVTGFTDTLSNCVQYQGCDAGFPVYWCQHTDPNYSNTNHGWPAFAPKMIWATFSAY
jgi:poly(3-hydroxybutyrate) depolymerase